MISFKRATRVRHKYLTYNDVGQLADPNSVTFKLEYGDDVTPALNFTVTGPAFADGPVGFSRVQVGWFEYVENATKPGVCKWRWEPDLTSGVGAPDEGKYEVEAGNFFP